MIECQKDKYTECDRKNKIQKKSKSQEDKKVRRGRLKDGKIARKTKIER